MLIAAEDGGVNLAALDVLLDQSRRVKLVLNVFHPLHEFLHAVNDRISTDSDGTILRNRLHDQREGNVVGVLDPAAIGGRKKWRLDTMELEHLFCRALILSEEVRM